MSSRKLFFLELIQIALGNRTVPSVSISENDWYWVLEKAKEQSLVGFLFTAIKDLPLEYRPPLRPSMLWYGMADYVAETYKKHIAVLHQTQILLDDAKIPHVFMKGLTCGLRYPLPSYRSCGDIDFVVDSSDFVRTLEALEKIGKVNRELIHEHHGMVHVGNIILEPHYKVHNYQNPKNDRAMKEMFKEFFPHSLRYVEIEGMSIPVFPLDFEGMFLISHMVNHVYEEGLGLRQVIDFYCYLKLYGKVPDEYFLGRMHMVRASRIFTRICEKYLGLPETICNNQYSEKEKTFAEKMFSDIMRVGNFGKATDYGKTKGITGSFHNYWMIVRRCYNLSFLCPAEAIYWPFSKFNRFFEKKMSPEKFQLN